MHPRASIEIPDDETFHLAWMPLDQAPSPDRASGSPPLPDPEDALDELHRLRGRTRRQYRNALGFALPDAGGLAEALEVARALLARNDGDGRPAEEYAFAELHPKLQGIYRRLLLPAPDQEYLGRTVFESLPLEPSPDLGLHEAAMRSLEPRFRRSLEPAELAAIVGLGRVDRAGVRRTLFPLEEAARWFFMFSTLPRFHDREPIRRAVAEGVAAGAFGLLLEGELRALDRLPEGATGRAIFRREIDVRSLDFAPGAYLVDAAALRESAAKARARA